MNESNPSERRVFLRVLGAAAATWAASACGGQSPGSGGGGQATTSGSGGAGGSGGGGGGTAGSGGVCTAGNIMAGDPSLYATDGLHKVGISSVLIGHDAGGYYALTAICTHRACNMNQDGTVSATGIRCDCHGSVFSLTGQVETGPAFSPLVAFALALSCGQLYIDTNKIVPNTDRLAV